MKRDGPDPLAGIEDELLRVEEDLSLVRRLSPLNYERERLLLEENLRRGKYRDPDFVYPSVDTLCLLRSEDSLSRARDSLLGAVPSLLGTLLLGRIAELTLEAEMVKSVGTERVRTLSAQRYPFSSEELSEAGKLSEHWLAFSEAASEPAQEVQLSSYLRARCLELGIEAKVVESSLSAVCGVGGTTVYVRRGAAVSEGEARRIFVHEIEGHLLPRLRAESLPAPYRIGTEGCLEDEEGRAILLEERAGTLGPERSRALAVRHQVAVSVLEGAEEATAERLARRVSAELLSECLCRALRGGGLCRERVYLPGYVRVKRALEEAPEIETLMSVGRISVFGARELFKAKRNQ